MIRAICRTALLLMVLMHCFSRPTYGQWLDPDNRWDSDQIDHMIAGALVNVAVRGPYIAYNWRNTVAKRMAWVLVLGTIYEIKDLYEHDRMNWLGNPGAGFGLLDLVADVTGAAIAEVIIWALERTHEYAMKLQFSM